VTRHHQIATTVALDENSRNVEMIRRLEPICAGIKRNYQMFKGLLEHYKALNAGAGEALTNMQAVYRAEATHEDTELLDDISNVDDDEHAD
jgi:hypothetical protein